jgi:hypothetical protein
MEIQGIMAHFAELDSNNIVLRVLVVRNIDMTDKNGQELESLGVAFLQNLFGGNWKQTSYNTKGNKHLSGGTPFRGNFAGVGHIYDEKNDVFYPPVAQYPSWIIGPETNWTWQAPVEKPEIRKNQMCEWDEDSKSWIVKTLDPETKTYI